MRYKYYLAVITAFSIWGFFSLVLKSLDAFPAFDILIYRAVTSVFIMLLVVVFLRPKTLRKNIQLFRTISKKNQQSIVIINLLSGLFLALNWFIFIYVMNNVSVSATSLAYLICPILTMVLAYLILKEKLFKIQWISVALSLISCLLLSLGNFMDLFYSMIIAFTYAIYLVLQRKNQEMDRFLVLTFQIGVAVVLLIPFTPSYISNIEKTTFFYAIIALIAVVFTIVPMYLNIYALKGLNSAIVGIFIYLNPIINFLLAVFYFKEHISFLQGLSFSLIAVSVIIFNIPNFRKQIKKRKATHIKI
ncbi:chloramphenicol-sensitive protein RarD [Mariniflexile fucanivorans]|uniref:Chloramphenicol-sensitive protein RarD n=1 Tax=Mariniflexile fucanivorans TaxID=264023 RepID=A0A4R1RBV5_9FLAO|nr:EamA family transporter [Mariniflexile fucanivorans]TCL63110.1 chloramphenicol-sensitive protein RarD [Mariniflexile fucanivorans]